MEVLGATKDKRAVLPLMDPWLLEDPEHAVQALVQIGPAAEDEIVAKRAMWHNNARVRTSAAQVLEQIGTAKSLEGLRPARTTSATPPPRPPPNGAGRGDGAAEYGKAGQVTARARSPFVAIRNRGGFQIEWTQGWRRNHPPSPGGPGEGGGEGVFPEGEEKTLTLPSSGGSEDRDTE